MISRRLNGYTLDIIDVTEFKDYYYKNMGRFSSTAENSFLKALDIPPKFYKEQPEETKKELIENREVFVRESKKFFNKVIVVVKYESEINDDMISVRILNACRLSRAEAEKKYEQLSTIEKIHNKFEHRSFIKDGYISLVISDGIEKNRDNKVLIVDFPIMLNKEPVIHRALYTLPDETFFTPVEHIQYLTSKEVKLGVDYNSIEEAVNNEIEFLTEDICKYEDTPILREVELVSIALQELKIIPKSLKEKISVYMEEKLDGKELTTDTLEKFVLDFDETVNGYKQVTSLREVSGIAVKRFLEAPAFKEFIENMEEAKEELLPL